MVLELVDVAVCRDNMTEEEAEEVVSNAIALAMSTDGSSGGLIRLVTVTKDGSKRKMIKGDEVPLFGEELKPSGATGMVIG
jgi:20S proteasome subunit beta 1